MRLDKPNLRLGFTDYFSPLDEFFTDVLSEAFTIIRDDKNPDYLIFCDETFGQNNRSYDPNKTVKIFFTGENRRPQAYPCHFAISFDHSTNDRLYRLPLYVVDNWVHVKKIGLPDVRDIQRNGMASDKTGFCSFVVANSGCIPRNNIFHFISQKYKQVDSGGPLFNNTGVVLPRDGINAQKSKFDFIKSRKFNICYENGAYPGYVTEKLFQALYTNTIPIYWGSPTVEMDFNSKAFISRHDYLSDDEMLEDIVALDQNDGLYNAMLSQPILNPKNNVLDLNRFRKWFMDVVYQGSRADENSGVYIRATSRL